MTLSGSSDGTGRALLPLQRREHLMEELRAHGAITVREIASMLGVSELTIRRDVNLLAGDGLVSRVHGGAVLPSPLERSRTAGKPSPHRYAVGMVVPSLDYYWPHVISGARAEADQCDLRILVRGSSYDAADNQKQVRALMEAHDIDGLIVAPEMGGKDGPEFLRWLNALPIPVVLVERRAPLGLPAHRIEWVATDHAFGAGMAVRHLWQEGHRRIGCLADSTSPTSPHVIRGWRQALASLQLPDGPSVCEDSARSPDVPQADLYDRILELCRRTDTTALLIHADTQALAFVQHCTDRGIAVPEDLAVVGYDDEVASLAEPPISAIRPPKHYVGRSAVQLMAARLTEGRMRPMHRLNLNPELILRGSSVGPPTAAAIED